MQKLLGKIGKVLFHRLGIVGVLILAQIVLYGVGLTVLWNSDSFGWVKWLFVALSVLSALWIVGSKSNPGYKIGWLIIVLGLMPFGSVAYLLLGGNHLSGFNQRRLRTMERKIRRNLGEECGRSASLGATTISWPPCGGPGGMCSSSISSSRRASCGTRCWTSPGRRRRGAWRSG